MLILGFSLPKAHMKTGIHISYMINNVVSLGRKKNKKNDQAILKPQKFCFDNKLAWFTIISLKIRTFHVNIREGEELKNEVDHSYAPTSKKSQ